MAVYGLGIMTPIGWGPAGLVWVHALIWALLTDPIKLLAYRIFDPIETPAIPKKPLDIHPSAAPVPS
jgi:H+-transporting ATPase